MTDDPRAPTLERPVGFRGEPLLAAAAIVMTTIPFQWAASADSADQEFSNPWLYLIYLVLLALLVWSERRRIVFTLVSNPVGPLLLLACVSAVWSEAPAITLQKWLSLAMTTLFGGYLAIRFAAQQRIEILAAALSIASVASLVMALVFPAFGVMSGYHEGEWCGIYNHKNVLGQIVCLNVLALIAVAWTRPGTLVRALCATGIVLDGLLMLMSRSQTSMVVCLSGILLFPTVWLLRRSGTQAFAALALIGGGASSLILTLASNQDIVLQTLGRDVTLTGRMQLWHEVLDAILMRPWLGFGYEAFWQGGEGHAGLIVGQFGNPIAYSHNGALELLLDLGGVGLLLFLAGYVFAMVRALRHRASEASMAVQWPFFYLVVFFLFNLTEASIIAHRNLLWVLYVVAVHSRSDEEAREAVRQPVTVARANSSRFRSV